MQEVIGWRIMVRPQDVEEQFKEELGLGDLAIEIPDFVKEKHERATVSGEVIGVGPWAFKAYFRSTNGEQFDCPVKVGDMVTFSKYSGQQWTDPDTDEGFLILNDEDIHTVSRKETN